MNLYELTPLLQFVGLFIGTLLLVSSAIPKGFRAIRFSLSWIDNVHHAAIHRRLLALEQWRASLTEESDFSS